MILHSVFLLLVHPSILSWMTLGTFIDRKDTHFMKIFWFLFLSLSRESGKKTRREKGYTFLLVTRALNSSMNQMEGKRGRITQNHQLKQTKEKQMDEKVGSCFLSLSSVDIHSRGMTGKKARKTPKRISLSKTSSFSSIKDWRRWTLKKKRERPLLEDLF